MNDFKKSLKVQGKNSDNKNDNNNKIYYIVYDENGNKIGTIYPEYKKLQSQWLKVITMFVITKNGKLLVEERAKTDLTPNKKDLVSGHIENQEKGKETAYREAKEEVGIKPKKILKIKKVKNNVPLIIENRKFFTKFYFAIANIDLKELKLQKEEVRSIIEVSLEEGFELIRQGETRFPYEGNEEVFEEIFEKVRKFYDKCFNKEKCKEMDEK